MSNLAPAALAADSGETLGLSPNRLTVTFGFGAGLFEQNGKDRYGLKSKKPEALIDLPYFNGDQLIEGRSGGDLSVQACANNPQVAFHAVRQLAREAEGIASIRWAQSGFSAQYGDKSPRNLMGFKDGTINPATPLDYDRFVWVGDEGPAWMPGGSYVVARRHPHLTRTLGPHGRRLSGAERSAGTKSPVHRLGGTKEFDPLDLRATDKDGNFAHPDDGACAHVAAPAMNVARRFCGAAIPIMTASASSPNAGRHGTRACNMTPACSSSAYQRDPRTGFVKIFDKLSKLDAMNQFTTHIGSGLFACPPGATEGGFIGDKLFES